MNPLPRVIPAPCFANSLRACAHARSGWGHGVTGVFAGAEWTRRWGRQLSGNPSLTGFLRIVFEPSEELPPPPEAPRLCIARPVTSIWSADRRRRARADLRRDTMSPALRRNHLGGRPSRREARGALRLIGRAEQATRPTLPACAAAHQPGSHRSCRGQPAHDGQAPTAHGRNASETRPARFPRRFPASPAQDAHQCWQCLRRRPRATHRPPAARGTASRAGPGSGGNRGGQRRRQG
jgi:hypothetical protein